jgi:ABC-type oligopeptide transport system ATPase subunit
MTDENVWPAGELTSLQKKETFSETKDTETVPLLPSKPEHQSKKKKRDNVSEADKGAISYTKAITAFRIELNAEAEFCHNLVPEVSTANVRQKRYSVLKH